MSKKITGIVEWLQGWFYTKQQVDSSLNNKANQSDLNTTNGNISSLQSTVNNKLDKSSYVVDNSLNSSSENPVQNKVVNNALSTKLNSSSYVVDSSLSSSSENPVQNKVVNSALSDKVDKVSGKGLSTNDYTTAEKNKLSGLSNYTHPSTHSTGMILESNSLDYLGVSSVTQDTVNLAVDEALSDLNDSIGDLTNIDVDLLKVVQTLPTASSSTMNALYLVTKSSGSSTNNSYDVYVTVKSGSNYSWEKLDDANISTINWNDISNKPSDYPPSAHIHPYVKDLELVDKNEDGTGAIRLTFDSNVSVEDLSDDETGVVSWLRDWFDDIYSQLGHTHSYNNLTDKPNIPSSSIVDDTVTQNSDHPVKSSGIYTALSDKADTNHTHSVATWGANALSNVNKDKFNTTYVDTDKSNYIRYTRMEQLASVEFYFNLKNAVTTTDNNMVTSIPSEFRPSGGHTVTQIIENTSGIRFLITLTSSYVKLKHYSSGTQGGVVTGTLSFQCTGE